MTQKLSKNYKSKATQEYMRKRIEVTRELAEMTIRDLSKLSGYSISLLSKYRNGNIPIMPETYRALMLVMNDRIKKLYHGEIPYGGC